MLLLHHEFGSYTAGVSKLAVKIGGETNPQLVPVPELAMGKEWRLTKKFTLNKAGQFIVKATADADNAIKETNEKNNLKQKTIKITEKAKPDLMLLYPDPSPSLS